MTSTIGVEVIDVRGARRDGLPDPTASRRIVDRARLVRASREGAEVGSIIDAVAGARVLELGGPLAERKLSVRGGGFDETLLVVDGVPLASPFATGLDVDLFPVDALDSIEVVRGGAGAMLGDGALAGALLLTTRRPKRTPTAALALSYGAFETMRATASGAASIGAVAASFERTRGNFPYISQLVALPDQEERRDNADATKAALSLFTSTDVAGTRLSLAFGGGVREGGVPGLETQEQQLAREGKRTAHLRLAVARAFEEAVFEGGVSGSLLDIDYRDENEAESDTRFHALDANARVSFPIGASQLARVAIAFGNDGVPESTRTRASTVISDELTLDAWSFFLALRAEKIGDTAIAVLPRAGLVWRASEELQLRAGAGRSLRAPTIDELHHPAEAGFSGNPALRAESSWEAELGASFAPIEALTLGASIFARAIDDGILYLNRNAFVIRPENYGDARVAGGELEATLAGRMFGFDAALELSGTAFASRLIESTGPLPTRPPWGGFAGVTFARSGLSVSTQLRALAPTWANLQSTLPIDLFARWDAAVVFEPSKEASIGLSVTNLLDDQTLESLNKLPLPGRAAFVTVRIASEGA